MRYFGLDLGEKTLGVAISESGIIAQSLTTIRFDVNDFNQALNELIQLIQKYRIDMVVIGLPKHMNNDLGEKGKMVLNFKEMIENLIAIPIIPWDERLSSRSALKALSDQNIKYQKQRALKDELAAQIILQNYLDSR